MSRNAVRLLLVVVSLVAAVSLVVGVSGELPTDSHPQMDSGNIEIYSFNAPSNANVGDTMLPRVNIRNTGTEFKRVTVRYSVGGQVVISRDVALESNEDTQISFEATVPELDRGTYTQEVSVADTGLRLSKQIIVNRQGQASFSISNFRAPSQSNPGSQVIARATVTNFGGAEGTTELEYRIGGNVVATRSVTLVPGERTAVTLTGSVPSLSSGSYQQGIFVGGTGNGQASSIFVGLGTSQFSVVSLQAPSQDSSGSSVSATATVRNTGSSRGSTTFEYRIRDRVVASRDVTLGAGESRSITLSGSVPDLAIGSYQQGVFVGASNSGLTSPFRVTGTGASFRVDDLSAPSRATSGDSATARATVRNTGRSRGSATFEYRIDGRSVGTRSVTLDAGGRTTVTLTGTVPDRSDGRYSQGVFVEGTNRGISADLGIASDGDSFFDIYDLRGPSQVEEGSEVTVRATVENVGDRTGSTRIEYRIRDSVVDSESVELRPGRSTTVRLGGTVPDIGPGTYRHGVFVGSTNRGQSSSLRTTALPRFRLTGFEAPSSARVGSSVSVRATVRNTGDSRATRTVEYRIGSNVIASSDSQVDAGSSRTVTLEGTVPSVSPGTYQQGVFVDGGALRRSHQVQPRTEARAEFRVTEIDAPSRASASERISVEANMRNVGNGSGSTPLEYRIGDNIVSTKRVGLDADEDGEVVFDVSVPDLSPGVYEHGVFLGGTDDGQTADIEITEAATEDGEETDGEGDGEDDGGGEGMPGFTLLAGLVALVTVATVSRHR